MRPRVFGDIGIGSLPSQVQALWYTRDDEPEKEEFDFLPEWMTPDATDEAQGRDLKRVVAYLLTTLTEREAGILINRYWHDLTLKEVSELMGISAPRVRQIEQGALRKLCHPSRSWLLTLATTVPKHHIERYHWCWRRYAGPSPEFIEWVRENPYKKVEIGVDGV